jgi:hypothetical protein
MSGITLTGMSALVDDETYMLDFLCMAVEKSGVGHVISASSGEEALNKVVEWPRLTTLRHPWT